MGSRIDRAPALGRGQKTGGARTRWRAADIHEVSPRIPLGSPLISLALLAACAGPGGSDAGADAQQVDGPATTVDAGVTDAATDATIVVTPPDAGPLARSWPRTTDALRAALGDRGAWIAAWQLDEPDGALADELGHASLLPRGRLAYLQPGAWLDDRAVTFDSDEDALVTDAPPFALDPTRSLAALLSIRLADDPGGGALASQLDAGGVGAILVALDPATGHLRAALGDGTRTATATLPIDHRDGRYHDVLVVIDRQSGVLRLLSDLGRSPFTSIVPIGDASTATAFTLGASRVGAAAGHGLTFAAVAAGDVAGLALDGDDALYRLRLATDRPAPIVRPPADLPWAPPWPIHRERRGQYTIDVDPHTLRVPTTADVWISPAGDDAWPGTPGLPLRSLRAAFAAIRESTTIHLAPGAYDADDGWYGSAPAYDVNLIAEGGRARLTSADIDLTWLPSPAGPGVFQTMAARDPYAVIDSAAAVGLDPWLAARGSVADVAATAGTWTATGARVTVHTRDGRAPDDRTLVLPAETLNGFINDPARTVYLEGLDFEGGYKALHVNRAHRLVLVDTTFRYGAGEGLSVLATDEVLAFSVVAEANAWDGLAYTAVTHVLEVGCVGRDNGRDGSNIDNGSTTHGTGTVIRLGGEYRDNGGPNVADVLGASSWDLGTIASGNHAIGNRINFFVDGEMWLREVNARDRTPDATIDLVTAVRARLHAHDTDRVTVGGTGTIDDRAE